MDKNIHTFNLWCWCLKNCHHFYIIMLELTGRFKEDNNIMSLPELVQKELCNMLKKNIYTVSEANAIGYAKKNRCTTIDFWS